MLLDILALLSLAFGLVVIVAGIVLWLADPGDDQDRVAEEMYAELRAWQLEHPLADSRRPGSPSSMSS
jgi:hypothetical protein